MKHLFTGILVCGLAIASSTVFGGTDKFELELIDVNETLPPNSLDIILTDVTPDVSGMTLVFASGSLAVFNSAPYYYFYQVENQLPGFINELTGFGLFLDPSTISTAGYISLQDLDDPLTFDHNVVGEFESTAGTLVDPLSTTILTDSIFWEFDPTIAQNDESAVLFITSNFSSTSSLAFAEGIDAAFETDVLVPGGAPAVPEPSAMLLFGFGIAIIGYAKKRLRK